MARRAERRNRRDVSLARTQYSRNFRIDKRNCSLICCKLSSRIWWEPFKSYCNIRNIHSKQKLFNVFTLFVYKLYISTSQILHTNIKFRYN